MSTNEDKKGIVLNRMYTGSYLSTNLGHEVINMFQADNGKHYLYLNAKGNFAKEHEKQISDMLLVRYAGDNKVEVLAWANGLVEVAGAGDTYKNFEQNGDIFKKQHDYIEENKITYGQRDLVEIFCGSVQQNVYITYCAKCFFRPTKKIYIKYVEENDLLYNDNLSNKEDSKKELTIFLSGYQFGKATLKQYIYPTNHKNSKYKFDKRKKNEEFKNNLKNSGKKEEDFIQGLEERVKGKRGEDWDILSQLLNCDYKVNDNKDNLWRKVADDEDKITDEIINSYQPRKVSLFDICQIQKDENRISNALSYFIDKYPKLWSKFFADQLNPEKPEFDEIESVTREESAKVEGDKSTGGRIDLLIRTKKYYIILENKIDSDIIIENGLTQLERYYNYVCFLKKQEIDRLNKEVKCLEGERNDVKSREIAGFVLTPNYNPPDKEDLKVKNSDFCFSWLSYKTIYDWLTSNEEAKCAIEEDANFKAFYNIIKRHKYEFESSMLYEDMKSTFFTRIKEIRSNQDNNA